MKNWFPAVARHTAPWVILLVLQTAPGFAQTVGDDGSRIADCQPEDVIRLRGATASLFGAGSLVWGLGGQLAQPVFTPGQRSQAIGASELQ